MKIAPFNATAARIILAAAAAPGLNGMNEGHRLQSMPLPTKAQSNQIHAALRVVIGASLCL